MISYVKLRHSWYGEKMSNLFIIGNGFDLSHGIKSSYRDFREYLQEQYDPTKHEVYDIPTINWEHTYDYSDIADFWFNVFDANNDDIEWSKFENSLYGQSYGDCFSEMVMDRDGEENLFKTVGNNGPLSRSIVDIVPFINRFFTEWINQIEIDDVKPRKEFQELIDRNKSIFFSTNYTLTLEKVYNISKVCHIHGKIGEDFIFGHGEDESLYEKYEKENIGTEYYLSHIDKVLRKDVQKALKTHRSFFELLGKRGIEKIYSYGFSYGKADLIYVQEIAKSLSRNVIWYLNSFDDANGRNSAFEYSIRACGFRGTFDRFS